MALPDLLTGLVADVVNGVIGAWTERREPDPAAARRLRRRLEWAFIAILLGVPAALTFWYR